MNHGQTTKAFLAATDRKTRKAILTSIANHYGISNDDVLAEVTGDEAESLLDYVTGSMRTATRVMMIKHGF